MQLKKAVCAQHSQTFLQLQAPGTVSRPAGPLPAPSPAGALLGRRWRMAGRLGLLLFLQRAMKWGFQGPASAQKSLRFSMCLGQAALKEERASENHLKGKWSAASLQRRAHLCLKPCLHSPCSVRLRWSSLTTNVSLFHFGLVGKEHGSAPTVRLLRPWEPCMSL